MIMNQNQRTNWIIFVVDMFLFVDAKLSSTSTCSDVTENGFCYEPLRKNKYLLYDVNPYEGFNLRRDVFMRFSIALRGSIEWHLVLPPWYNLPHWKNSKNRKYFWGDFFDLSSLKNYAPVVEMFEFFDDYGKMPLNNVLILQHYQEMWEGDFVWENKWEISKCQKTHGYKKNDHGFFEGSFLGYQNITAKYVDCVSFHGTGVTLKKLLDKFKGATLVEHGEVVLHDHYADEEYWNCRKSMKFSPKLVEYADNFRINVLQAKQIESSVRSNNVTGEAYLGVHLRRNDYVRSRPNEVPSIEWAVKQIKEKLESLSLNIVFIATDASPEEISLIKKLIFPYKMFTYDPHVEIIGNDGAIAIVEQIICSRARYFIGTVESTFSFRIQEEREILRFPPDTTFNRLCGDNAVKCEQPTRWLLVE